MEIHNSNVSEIRDKSPKFVSFAREHQTGIMIGAAVLIVLVVAMSNSGTPKAPKVSSRVDPSLSQPKPATPEQVKAFSAELQKQTANLAQERERMQALQAAQQGGQVPPMPQGGYQPAVVPQSQQYVVPVSEPARTAAAEHKAASNLFISFREGAQQQQPSTPASDQSDLKGLIEAQRAALAETLKASVPQSSRSESPTVAKGSANVGGNDAPTEKTYKVFEGTVIESVLTNRLNGDFSGPISVLVTNPVMSHDQQHVLIQRGSRVIGEVKRVGTQGQQRLAVSFHRIIQPDGFSTTLDQFPGLNQIGETGLKDRTNHHYFEIFGTSVALGLVSGFSQFRTGSALTTNGVGQYEQGVASSVGQSSSQVLESKLNILPTVQIIEGHRVRVWIQKDLDLPAYEDHKLPGDL